MTAPELTPRLSAFPDRGRDRAERKAESGEYRDYQRLVRAVIILGIGRRRGIDDLERVRIARPRDHRILELGLGELRDRIADFDRGRLRSFGLEIFDAAGLLVDGSVAQRLVRLGDQLIRPIRGRYAISPDYRQGDHSGAFILGDLPDLREPGNPVGNRRNIIRVAPIFAVGVPAPIKQYGQESVTLYEPGREHARSQIFDRLFGFFAAAADIYAGKGRKTPETPHITDAGGAFRRKQDDFRAVFRRHGESENGTCGGKNAHPNRDERFLPPEKAQQRAQAQIARSVFRRLDHGDDPPSA